MLLDQKVQDYNKKQELNEQKKEKMRVVSKAEEERRRALNEGKNKKIEEV